MSIQVNVNVRHTGPGMDRIARAIEPSYITRNLAVAMRESSKEVTPVRTGTLLRSFFAYARRNTIRGGYRADYAGTVDSRRNFVARLIRLALAKLQQKLKLRR